MSSSRLAEAAESRTLLFSTQRSTHESGNSIDTDDVYMDVSAVSHQPEHSSHAPVAEQCRKPSVAMHDDGDDSCDERVYLSEITGLHACLCAERSSEHYPAFFMPQTNIRRYDDTILMRCRRYYLNEMQ